MTSSAVELLTEKLLAAAKRAGADGADAIAIAGTSINVDVRAGALEQAERAEATDVGLRVFVGQQQAIVSGSDTSEVTMARMAERAIAMAKEAPEDPYAGLAEPGQFATQWDTDALEMFDASPEPDPDKLQSDALEAEATAIAFDGVSQVQSATSAYGAREVHLATSNGFSGGYKRSDWMTGCTAITGEGAGMERDGAYEGRTFQSDLPAPAEIGKLAAERALARRDARKPPTGNFPVLFDERIAASLVGHLLIAANGASVARGSSWLLDRLGTQVLPDGLDLLEDPHRPRAAGSRAFDAEGLATQPRKIVENGVLQGWTLDLATGRKLNMPSTANAARSVSGGISPTTWNVVMTQGNQSRADLLKDMGTGLLVTSMIGSTINPNTGDYSRGAAGHWVENGEITYAVNECTIAGNLLGMLRSIIPANDARTHTSRVVPSLLVSGLTLAGD